MKHFENTGNSRPPTPPERGELEHLGHMQHHLIDSVKFLNTLPMDESTSTYPTYLDNWYAVANTTNLWRQPWRQRLWKKKQLNVALVWKATNCGLEWPIMGSFLKLLYNSGPSIGCQAVFWLLSGTCIDGIETCIKLVRVYYYLGVHTRLVLASGHTGLVGSLIYLYYIHGSFFGWSDPAPMTAPVPSGMN
jgi:hypothetical protein